MQSHTLEEVIMQVETFEVEKEVNAAGEVAQDAECIALIEKLGLTGQKSLIHSDDRGEDAKLCPYRQMTAEELNVYSQLCPQKTELKEYKDEAIPLRILQVAAHAADFFPCLQVWHPTNADVKDPVLVGRQNSWSGPIFILGRWGAVLEPLSVLKKQACAIYRETCIQAMLKIKAQCEADIERVKNDPTMLSSNTPQYFFNV